jgi:hypothetical protein
MIILMIPITMVLMHLMRIIIIILITRFFELKDIVT